MKMVQTECSETLSFKLHSPGNNPEESLTTRLSVFSVGSAVANVCVGSKRMYSPEGGCGV
jgi:hypothetical protein